MKSLKLLTSNFSCIVLRINICLFIWYRIVIYYKLTHVHVVDVDSAYEVLLICKIVQSLVNEVDK